MGDLGGETDLWRPHSSRFGDVTPVGMADAIQHIPVEHIGTETLQTDELAVLGQDPVLRRVEGEGGTDDRSLAAVDRGVRAGPTLALQIEDPSAEQPGRQHVGVHVTHRLVARRRVGMWRADHRPIVPNRRPRVYCG